jgi:hypothetical protein
MLPIKRSIVIGSAEGVSAAAKDSVLMFGFGRGTVEAEQHEP